MALKHFSQNTEKVKLLFPPNLNSPFPVTKIRLFSSCCYIMTVISLEYSALAKKANLQLPNCSKNLQVIIKEAMPKFFHNTQRQAFHH